MLQSLESILVFDITMVIQVILIDLALGADNSVVIGLAAKNLRPELQRKAIWYGTAGAILLRFLMAFAVSWVLQIPYAKTIGGLILVYIGISLIGAKEAEGDMKVDAKNTLLGAIKTIMMADMLMSMDNVLGIVGVTNNHWGLLILGMLISVPIIVFGSTVVVKVMHKLPVLIYIGGAILAWAAASMVITDQYLATHIGDIRAYSGIVKAIFLVLTVGGGFLWKYSRSKGTE